MTPRTPCSQLFPPPVSSRWRPGLGGAADPRAIPDDLSGAEHHEVVAEPLHQVELVRGEQDRDAAAGDLAQQGRHAVHGEWVQARERLVEHQQGRLAHQRRDDLHPLLVAQRQRLQLGFPLLVEAEALEQSSTARCAPRGARPRSRPR